MIEPFALLGALAALSLGVIRIVEGGVPSKASYVDQARSERARSEARESGIDYSVAFDEHWVPEHAADDPLFLDTPLPTAFADPLADPLADPPPLAAPSRGAGPLDASAAKGEPTPEIEPTPESAQDVDETFRG